MVVHGLMNKIPWKRLFRFAMVGGSAFVIDFATYYMLTRVGHVPYLLGRIISISGAMLWNFTLNRNWTFQAKKGGVSQQAPRFLTVMAATSLLNLVLMRIGVSYFHLNDLLVMIGVSLCIMLINFFAHQQWSYAPRSSTTASKPRI
jgi:putative flippase GtrA